MEIDCDALVQRYLLIKNPVYTFNFPISILIAIIVFGFLKANRVSDNSYINQILIPICALLVSMVVIDMACRAFIDKDEQDRLKKLCLSYMNDPSKKKRMLQEKIINMFEVDNYDGKIDGFTNQENEQVKDEIELDNIYRNSNDKHIYDNITTKFIENTQLMSTRQEIKGYFPRDKIECVGDTKSTNCNLCSGSGSNPENIVAPIPGPQWLPQNAETVQRRLKTNNYTKNQCKGNPSQFLQ